MLSIRFNRTGKKNRATFRVVLQEKTQAPGRRHVELLGSYDPHSKEAMLNGDRINYWIGEGAEVSDSVHNLLVREGVLKDGKKRAVKMPKPVAKEDEASPQSSEAGEKKEEGAAEEAAAESADAGEAGKTEAEKSEEESDGKEEPASEKPEEPSEEKEKKEEKSE